MSSDQKKKNEKKETRGRKTRYKKEYAAMAKDFCLLGMTDKQLADCFSVSETTLNNWKRSHDDFLVSIKAGKIIADARVAGSLYERAVGFSHEEDKIFQYEGVPIVVPTTKHYPPDATSMIFWLKNRQPELWREKVNENSTNDESVPIGKVQIEVITSNADS